MKLRHVSTAFLVTCLLLCSQGQAEVIATGDVDPSGATDPWEVDGDLKVGEYGEGTLNITGGGTVNVAGDTRVAIEAGSSGVINFDNGTLNTGELFGPSSNLQGTGTINTHGLVSDVNLISSRVRINFNIKFFRIKVLHLRKLSL